MGRKVKFGRWLASAATVTLLAAAPAAAIPIAVVASALSAITGTTILASSFIAIATAVAVNVGISVLASVLLRPSSKQQERQAAATTLQLGEQPRSALFGIAANAGDLLDCFNYGGDYGTDWEVLDIAVADHRCAGLVGFYVNDSFVAFAGTAGAPWTVPGYNGQLIVTWHEGTEAQAADPTFIAHGGSTSADNLAGVAHVVVAYKSDDQSAKNPIWTSGRPTFLWIVKGAYCYDPRKDSTVVGGSGSHRWATPSTWEWSENPIVCRYNWVRGIYACYRVDQPDQLLVGRGLTAIEAPPENVAAYANICDEAVALAAGGTARRYRIGGSVKADDEYIDTEEAFAAACAGVILQPGGSVEIEPGHAKAPVATITDDDVIVGASLKFAPFRSESDSAWVNTVIPRYVEPTQKWADHAAPIRRVYADVIADGKARENTLSLTLVTDGLQAQRCGEIARRLGRLVRSTTLTVGPRFAALEDGDWIIWQSKRRTGNLPVLMRVDAYGLDAKWQNTLQLREVATAVYDWTTADEIADGAIATQQALPDFTAAPKVADWTLTGGASSTSGGSVPALIVTGAVPAASAASVSGVLFDYRTHVAGQGDEVGWSNAGGEAASVTRKEIVVAPGAVDDVSVRYMIAGAPTNRLILGPVTAGALTATAPATPGQPSVAAANGTGSNVVTVRAPQTAPLDHIDLLRGTTNDPTTMTVIDAGLIIGLGATYSDTYSASAGTWWYSAIAYAADGTPSTPATPVSAVIS